MLANVKKKLSTLPLCPGVYLMKDIEGNIIYVGKSKLLKNRVSQYFQNSAAHSPKTLAMVNQIADFEYIITDTENEALALECNLIKKHLPKYNILLKDDKRYPYIKVTTAEDFPRVFITRQIKKDGNLYLGPFMSALTIKEALDELRKTFKIRNCSRNLTENKLQKPCLYYQIGQCSGPCNNKISKSDYNTSVNNLVDILNGNCKEIIKELTRKMQIASNELEFERAAQIRDTIENIKTFAEKQKVSSASNENMDFIGAYKENEIWCIQIFNYRGGDAVGSEYFTLENDENSPNEVIESVVKQFYFTNKNIPKQVFLSHEIEDKTDIEAWLSDLVGHKVCFSVPKRGKKADIMKMLLKNAKEILYKERMFKTRNEAYKNKVLLELKELLSLEKIPYKIEAYDISNTFGQASIGVQVVYQNAAPQKKLYRKYNIKTVTGSDDYESMREVLNRRINEAYKEEDLIKEGKLKMSDAKFLPLPDLILLDGGKGHVSAVEMLLSTLGEEINLFGLVKDNSHKTRAITSDKEEFLLEKNSNLFKFLACMQDEVHRYAITSHRQLRQKTSTRSSLEKISGVGPSTRKKLLAHFKGINGVKMASFEELNEVVGEKTAKNIIDFFQNKND